MSKTALGQVVQRAISDAAFRRQLQSDPAGALKGFDLTSDEKTALRSGNAARLSALGVDQRMSKAFALGDATSAVTRFSSMDVSSAASVGGDSDAMVSDALAGGAARESDALISGGTSAHAARGFGEAEGARASIVTGEGEGARAAIPTGEGEGARAATSDSDYTGLRAARAEDELGSRAATSDSDYAGLRAARAEDELGSRAAVDSAGGGGREGSAYITADEAGRDVAGSNTAAWRAADIEGSPESQAHVSTGDVTDASGWQSRDEAAGGVRSAFASADAPSGRETDAFLSADEAGRDFIPSAGENAADLRLDSADIQREMLDADTGGASPQSHGDGTDIQP